MAFVNILQRTIAERLNNLVKKSVKSLVSFSPANILSEDLQYTLYFMKVFLPELYRRHTAVEHASCIFCANLVRTQCHSNCYKCSAGTYIRCSSLLPGVIYKESSYSEDADKIKVPWYYKKPCPYFKRLAQHKYHKNIYSLFNPVGIHHIEILEGLESGLCSDARPCHICASVNYELYRKCTAQDDFEENTPCHKIKSELKKIFKSQ
jgi:hypothetical protein